MKQNLADHRYTYTGTESATATITAHTKYRVLEYSVEYPFGPTSYPNSLHRSPSGYAEPYFSWIFHPLKLSKGMVLLATKTENANAAFFLAAFFLLPALTTMRDINQEEQRCRERIQKGCSTASWSESSGETHHEKEGQYLSRFRCRKAVRQKHAKQHFRFTLRT